MVDVVNAAKRSLMMAGIRGKNTRPEIYIRSLLHKEGFRYRLHVRNLPGKPDIVLPRFNAAIFIHGCFWHGHSCSLFKLPSTRQEFWQKKIDGNRDRDMQALEKLANAGWRIANVWECSMRGKGRIDTKDLVKRLSKWIKGNSKNLVLSGKGKG